MTHEEVAYQQGRDSVIDALCNWMLENGFTTGHGDNIGAVLAELGEQVAAIRRQRDDERERCAKIVEEWEKVGVPRRIAATIRARGA